MSSILSHGLRIAWLTCALGLSAAWIAFLGFQIFRAIVFFI